MLIMIPDTSDMFTHLPTFGGQVTIMAATGDGSAMEAVTIAETFILESFLRDAFGARLALAESSNDGSSVEIATHHDGFKALVWRTKPSLLGPCSSANPPLTT